MTQNALRLRYTDAFTLGMHSLCNRKIWDAIKRSKRNAVKVAKSSEIIKFRRPQRCIEVCVALGCTLTIDLHMHHGHDAFSTHQLVEC